MPEVGEMLSECGGLLPLFPLYAEKREQAPALQEIRFADEEANFSHRQRFDKARDNVRDNGREIRMVRAQPGRPSTHPG